MPSPRAYLWALRASMLVLVVLAVTAIASADDGRASGAGAVATIAWAVTAAALAVALIVPGPLGLAVARVLVPATVPATTAALILGADAPIGTAALALAAATTLLAMAAESGEAMVQASAYGDERRFPLRVPVTYLLPMSITWLLWCVVSLAAVLLLCAQVWVLGALVTVVALAATVLLIGRMRRFAMRWLVIVPAGVVLHDPVVLAETLMVPRANVTYCRLAPAGTEAADLTGPAAGHAIDVGVKEMALVALAARPGAEKGSALHVQSFLVAPSRPGRALRALGAARLPVG